MKFFAVVMFVCFFVFPYSAIGKPATKPATKPAKPVYRQINLRCLQQFYGGRCNYQIVYKKHQIEILFLSKDGYLIDWSPNLALATDVGKRFPVPRDDGRPMISFMPTKGFVVVFLIVDL